MRFLLTLVACCGTNDCKSSATPSYVSNSDGKNLIVRLVHENKLGGGKVGGKSGRQPLQWRPSLCTISEEDVVFTEVIQLYVTPYQKSKKNTKMSTQSFTPSGHKNEFVLRGSWDMVSPVPTSFLF